MCINTSSVHNSIADIITCVVNSNKELLTAVSMGICCYGGTCVSVNTADLKAFFVDVVKPKASPKARPRSQSDKPKKGFSPVDHLGRELIS